MLRQNAAKAKIGIAIFLYICGIITALSVIYVSMIYSRCDM